MADNPKYKSALNKAMMLCSKKEYCCDDMRTKLYSWGLATDDTEKVISTLLTEKFINEQRYSNAYSRDKFNYNKWGKIKIASNLKQKKIPSDTIKSALESIDDETYIKVLRNLIEVHKRKTKFKNQYELRGKLMRFGLSKGFESNLIYEILGED